MVEIVKTLLLTSPDPPGSLYLAHTGPDTFYRLCRFLSSPEVAVSLNRPPLPSLLPWLPVREAPHAVVGALRPLGSLKPHHSSGKVALQSWQSWIVLGASLGKAWPKDRAAELAATVRMPRCTTWQERLEWEHLVVVRLGAITRISYQIDAKLLAKLCTYLRTAHHGHLVLVSDLLHAYRTKDPALWDKVLRSSMTNLALPWNDIRDLTTSTWEGEGELPRYLRFSLTFPARLMQALGREASASELTAVEAVLLRRRTPNAERLVEQGKATDDLRMALLEIFGEVRHSVEGPRGEENLTAALMVLTGAYHSGAHDLGGVLYALFYACIRFPLEPRTTLAMLGFYGRDVGVWGKTSGPEPLYGLFASKVRGTQMCARQIRTLSRTYAIPCPCVTFQLRVSRPWSLGWTRGCPRLWSRS